MGIFHAHAARLHAPDSPGIGAEQKDVAGQALDREILVQGAHDLAVRFGHDRHSCGLRELRRPMVMAVSRAPRRPRSTSVNVVAMQVRSAAPALRS